MCIRDSLYRATESLSDLIGMPSDHPDPGGELPSESEQLFGPLGEGIVLPDHGYRAQHRQQGGRGGEHDLAAHGVLVQARIGGQRGREDGLSGHEADDELGRDWQRRPILLARCFLYTSRCV